MNLIEIRLVVWEMKNYDHTKSSPPHMPSYMYNFVNIKKVNVKKGKVVSAHAMKTKRGE
jgi:hypothetical protein